MKKFITALAATFATVVIGSAASAATPTFNVYHEEVLPALVETVADYNWDAIPTSERITPVTVANYNWDAIPASEHFTIYADPFAEEIVGGLGPQLPYDPMRGVDYGFVQALLQQNTDPFAEQIVGGLGPQSDLDPMMTVMTDWVQPAPNVDSFSEEVVGGLGPQINFVASN